MNILLLDFEATSVDPKTARVLEIGAMLTDSAFTPTGAGMSQLVWESGYPALTAEVEKVTNISQDMLTREGVRPLEAFSELAELAEHHQVDAVIAYNTAYDHELFKAEVERQGFGRMPGIARMLQVPWICAMSDLETNYAFKSWRLMHVALEYGVTVNPKELHRAIADVELMRQMLVAAGATPGGMLNFKQEPWIFVRAVTTAPWEDGGKSNEIAKSLGFRWERAAGSDRTFSKSWVKRIKERHLPELLQAPIKIVRL